MAAKSTTERDVKVKFDGESSGMKRAAREAERELERLRKTAEREQQAFVKQSTAGADKVVASLKTMATGVLAVGSAVGSAQGLAGVAATVATMSGALLAVPGVALAGAAAIGTFKLATAGFADAVAADDAKAWTEATKNMAPAAVKTAQAVRDQKDELADLRKTVQGRFFEGFDGDVRSLADRYFPILKTQTADIAGELNSMGRASAKALFAPSAVDDVNQILGSTKSTLNELEPAAANVLSALLNLGGAGAQKATSLGKAITNVTADFKKWVDTGVESGEINRIMDEGIATAKDFGRVLGNLAQIGGKLWKGLNEGEQDFLDGIIETTQAVEDFLDSAEGQEAIRALGETLRVTADVARNVLSAALREIGPLIRDAAPAVQEFARGVGEFLVNAIQTVGPLLQGVARFLSENKDAVGELAPMLLGLAVAYKGLKVAQDVHAWMGGIPGLFGDIGRSADSTAGKIGDPNGGKGLAGKLGGLKALGGAAILGAAAVGIDQVNTSAGNAENLQGFADDLHNVVGGAQQIASLDIAGIFKDIGDELGVIEKKFSSGESPLGKLFNPKPDAKRTISLSITANTLDAKFETEKLLGFINHSAGTVNINGNDNPAGFALRQILHEISQGKESVIIDGKPVPAQEALARVVDQINRSSGDVKLNGNDTPAGSALQLLLAKINGSQANVNVGANTSSAQGVIDSFIRMNNGKTVQIYTSVLGSGGLASAGRLATGGAVRGPGTGTSDTAGLYALSNGEHVWTAAEVAAVGGQEAMYRMRRAALAGVRGLAEGGAVTPRYLSASIPRPRVAVPNVSVAAPNTTVTVMIDGREVRAVVDQRIDKARRQDRRVAGMRRGGAW